MSYIDDQIIKMRLDNSYLRTIHQFVISQCPLIDEQICLGRVLTTLDSKNLPYSRKEVRTAFMKFYNKEFHGSAIEYLNWLCGNCTRKVVFLPKLKSSMQNKPQVFEKQAVAVTSGGISRPTTHKLRVMSESKGNGCLVQQTPCNPHIIQSVGVLGGVGE